MRHVSTEMCPRTIRLESDALDTCYYDIDGADNHAGTGQLIVSVDGDTPVAQFQFEVVDSASMECLDANVFLSLDQMRGLIAMLQAALPTLQAIEFDVEGA